MWLKIWNGGDRRVGVSDLVDHLCGGSVGDTALEGEGASRRSAEDEGRLLARFCFSSRRSGTFTEHGDFRDSLLLRWGLNAEPSPIFRLSGPPVHVECRKVSGLEVRSNLGPVGRGWNRNQDPEALADTSRSSLVWAHRNRMWALRQLGCL